MMRIAVLDIGGTSIKSGIWDGNRLDEFKEWDTNASRGGGYLMERAKEILRIYGALMPLGLVLPDRWTIRQERFIMPMTIFHIIQGWKIRAVLENEFGVPVAVENDVNAAAIGVLYFGAAGAGRIFCV